MAQVTTCPSPTRQPAPLRVAPSTAARSRATEGFSATTATRPAESGFSGIERYGVSARSRELKPVLVVGDRGYRALAAINRARADASSCRWLVIVPGLAAVTIPYSLRRATRMRPGPFALSILEAQKNTDRGNPDPCSSELRESTERRDPAASSWPF